MQYLNSKKTRASLFGIAAFYLLYLAYGLFKDRRQTDTSMSPAARILFIAFFMLAAIALIVYAVREWLKADREEKHPPEDPKSLK